MSNQTEKYDAATISLHWTTALLVVVLWVIGRTAHSLPRGAFQTGYWSTHVVLGFALAARFLVRIGWRSTAGRGLPAANAALPIVDSLTH